MEVKFTKNHFQQSKNIIWEDVILQMSEEFKKKTHKMVITDLNTPPTIVLHGYFFPNTIGKAFKEVNSEIGVNHLHLYTSFGQNSSTFGRHKDTTDVLIVQSIGSICYSFDDGKIYKLDPGDSIFIPKGIYHTPLVLEPRVTLSFSW